MIIISKKELTEKLVNNSTDKNTNQLIAKFLKIRNNKLYFTTPAKYETDYKDLIIINPDTYEMDLYDTKFYLKALFSPALITDKDIKEIRSYLTHMTGKVNDLKRNMSRKDLDKITSRIIEDEIKEKVELRKYYKLEL
ncbi:MAG: hypothetical protein IJH55_05565 [Romboutsia sp.]|nr:hypothetical protein [Romboutsia sp.]